ncbi:hypothetical protein GGR54DRAFT_55362 [Hypoxylon sp. NC1633]|nr:hypothetical protein GGR54DRAFT_55362 [Hypoxylon sp. NC1633]
MRLPPVAMTILISFPKISSHNDEVKEEVDPLIRSAFPRRTRKKIEDVSLIRLSTNTYDMYIGMTCFQQMRQKPAKEELIGMKARVSWLVGNFGVLSAG